MSEPGPAPHGRDRLRELLDSVLDEDNRTLDDMAGDAFSSSFHFSRRLSRDTGEPPVAMKRRVLLERAAWRLRQGAAVTDTAFEAGYESVEGFSRAFGRAFGHPPSRTAESGAGHWLAAPNGVHFHPPMSLWVDAQAESTASSAGDVVGTMVLHDVDDTRDLLEQAKALTQDELDRAVIPGAMVLQWDGPEESITALLDTLVWSKEVWVASIIGADLPERGPRDLATLFERHEAVAPRWLAAVRDIEQRRAWQDRLVDALCEPPETFVVGSVVAHVLTFSAHRRQLVRQMFRLLGHETDHGDPIDWHRRHIGGEA